MKLINQLKLLMIVIMIMSLAQISNAESFNIKAIKVLTEKVNDSYTQPNNQPRDMADSGNHPYDTIVFFKVMIAGLVCLLIVTGVLYYLLHQRSVQLTVELRKSLNDQAFCLEQVLEEKDWLMKEIHHRVKNTLQIVMSLLNTQLVYLVNNEAIEAIRNSQHRMFAISLIHQKMYQSENLSAIDMEAYIPELLEYLKDELDTGGRISYKIGLVPLSLDVSRALSLGLILNEAVSNALKFAFPTDQAGEISLKLTTTDEQYYIFNISDNGVGLKDGFNTNTNNSFGQTLMAGLTKQLGGSYQLENNHGVSVHIAFSKDEYTMAI